MSRKQRQFRNHISDPYMPFSTCYSTVYQSTASLTLPRGRPFSGEKSKIIKITRLQVLRFRNANGTLTPWNFSCGGGNYWLPYVGGPLTTSKGGIKCIIMGQGGRGRHGPLRGRLRQEGVWCLFTRTPKNSWPKNSLGPLFFPGPWIFPRATCHTVRPTTPNSPSSTPCSGARDRP